MNADGRRYKEAACRESANKSGWMEDFLAKRSAGEQLLAEPALAAAGLAQCRTSMSLAMQLFLKSASRSVAHGRENTQANAILCSGAGSARELIGVALPLVISSGSASLMYVIDRVSHLGLDRCRGGGTLPASMLHWTLMSLAIGTVNYVNAFVARSTAGEPRRIGAIVWQGVYLSLLAGVAVLGCIPLPENVRLVRPRSGDPAAGDRVLQRAVLWGLSAAIAKHASR